MPAILEKTATIRQSHKVVTLDQLSQQNHSTLECYSHCTELCKHVLFLFQHTIYTQNRCLDHQLEFASSTETNCTVKTTCV